MEEKDFLWGMYQEHCNEGRHHEEQRSTMSNLIIVLSGGVLGLMTIKDLSFNTWPLGIFLILIGIFGSLFCAKHYSKWKFHMMLAGRYRNKLEKYLPDTKVRDLRLEVGEEHKSKTNLLINKIRLHQFWIGLHLLITLMGIVTTIVILLTGHKKIYL